MHIRSATEADTQAVLELWRAAGLLTYLRQPEHDITRALRNRPDLFLLAEDDDGSPMGTVQGTTDGRTGWIFRLAVGPAHRRSGVGRALVDHLEQRFAEFGLPRVNLLVLSGNTQALSFWDRLGYAEGPPVVLRSKSL